MPLVTFNFTADQLQRMATAIGAIQGLNRDATAQETKDYWVAQMRQLVQMTERRRAAALIPDNQFDPG